MGKSGGKAQVSRYSMSMHVGICAAGRTLQLLEVKVGEKRIWRGQRSRRNVMNINRPNLFGGDRKEGGVFGLMWWLNGDPTQTLPGPLFSRLGRTRENCPGFRGVASLFFTGRSHLSEMSAADRAQFPNAEQPVDGSDAGVFENYVAGWGRFGYKGFNWCANNPYLKTISARVRRAPEGLNPSIALIPLPDSSEGIAQYGANPAHMIFESMTNQDWGMGESFGAFNVGSFETAAQTLYDEGFGLNMIWTRQSKVEDFIGEVLSHIQGAVFVDPATGKHTLKLMRADYDAATLPIITPDNARLSSFKRKMWAEVANEMTVTWTNPETSKEETVTAQDNAAIAMQGGVSTDSRNYYGIGSQQLAMKVAERDLAAVVHPLATCEAEVNREFWETVTYDVVRLNWPKYGVGDVVFRVSEVRQGSSDRKIILSLYEDIFGRSSAEYLEESDTGWHDDTGPVEPIVRYKVGTAPAFMMASSMEGVDDPSDLVYPEAVSLIAAARNYYSDTGYYLHTYETNSNGQSVPVELGERALQDFWLSTVALPPEASSIVANFLGVIGSPPEVGSYLLIGTGADEDTEICLVTNYVDGVGYSLRRGILDTTPKNWPVGTPVFIFPELFSSPDPTRRTASEEVRYRFSTITPNGDLDRADTPEVSTVLSERPHLPTRPANVRVGGVAFGTFNMGSDTEVEITWANRNRVAEASQILDWTAASVSGEAGQTTTIAFEDQFGNEFDAITGLTGTSRTVQRGRFDGLTDCRVKVYAERDGMRSLQAHSIRVTLS